jgi:hypothetical protein
MYLRNILCTPFPGAIETKPGSAFFGIEPAILDPLSGKVSHVQSLSSEAGLSVCSRQQCRRRPRVEAALAIYCQDSVRRPPTIPRHLHDCELPSIDRSLRITFLTCPQCYPGFYFTGDGASRDEDGKRPCRRSVLRMVEGRSHSEGRPSTDAQDVRGRHYRDIRLEMSRSYWQG